MINGGWYGNWYIQPKPLGKYEGSCTGATGSVYKVISKEKYYHRWQEKTDVGDKIWVCESCREDVEVEGLKLKFIKEYKYERRICRDVIKNKS